jgi:hypothetical protein
LWLIDPAGHAVKEPAVDPAAPGALSAGGTVGPPYAQWLRASKPAPGTWTAMLADGDEVLACERIRVAPGPTREAAPAPAADGTPPPAWTPRVAWEEDTENLYAAWVTQLFDYPMSEETTWTNLQTLLQNPEKNFLLGHLGEDEDAALKLSPDCADLPYFLRAYFAWKLGLPFALRRCSRGKTGAPPSCGELVSNLAPTEGATNMERFARFMRVVGSGVHSATARTAPRDEDTDVYPVALSRVALKPGTVFADPYGHLLVISRWIAQAPGKSGLLVGAEAQPDGTIGRRTFWEGTFLFTPETKDVGAGFKAWRPLTFDRKTGALTPMTNDELAHSKTHTAFSLEQYEGTKNDFYAKVDRLANARARDAATVLRAKVDALDEAAKRRVLSVQNGVDYMNSVGWRTVPMPDGYDVFETEGPWEDFATPARDLRLLIAIDAVRGFPDRVAASPAEFGAGAGEQAGIAAKLRALLEQELASRSFTYVGSAGKPVTLTLKDVFERSLGFEVSYNPNDCPEIRWAAPRTPPKPPRARTTPPRTKSPR